MLGRVPVQRHIYCQDEISTESSPNPLSACTEKNRTANFHTLGWSISKVLVVVLHKPASTRCFDWLGISLSLLPLIAATDVAVAERQDLIKPRFWISPFFGPSSPKSLRLSAGLLAASLSGSPPYRMSLGWLHHSLVIYSH